MDNFKMAQAIEDLVSITGKTHLAQWVDKHINAMCRPSSVLIAVCKRKPVFSLTPQFVSDSFPRTLLQIFNLKDAVHSVPLLRDWKRNDVPTIKVALTGDADQDSLWRIIFEKHGFGRVMVAVSCDIHGEQFSYFCITDPQIQCDQEEDFSRSMIVIARMLGNILFQLESKSTREEGQQYISLLTPRELEILKWIGIGKTNYEISRILDVAVPTIKNHVQKILIKLQVSNRTQAIYKINSSLNLGGMAEGGINIPTPANIFLRTDQAS